MKPVEAWLEVSTHLSEKYAARWYSTGKIVLYLGSIYANAKNYVKESYNLHDGTEYEDLVFNEFIEYLTFHYLEERLCLERANQHIRVKHDRCEPCCIRPYATAMLFGRSIKK